MTTLVKSKAGCLGLSVRFGLAGLAIAMTLAVLELGARIVGQSRATGCSYLQCDPRVGWIGKANDRFEVSMPDGSHIVVRNSQGMHDTEHAVAKPPDTLRIAIVGDSFVEALQVAERNTYRRILEEILNSRSDQPVKYEVLSFGVGGWSPGQELIFMQRSVFQFAPDVVIAFWYPGNDLGDVLPGYRYQTCRGEDCYAPYFVGFTSDLDERPWYTAPSAPAACDRYDDSGRFLALTLHWVHQWSRFYQRLGPRLVHAGHGTGLHLPAWETPWQREALGSPAMVEGWRLNALIYSRMIREVRNHGARFAAVIVPYGPAAETEATAAHRVTAPARIDDPRLPNRRFAELMAEHDVAVLDLQDRFVAELQETNEAPFWPDSHWNARGNRIAAEAVAQWLISSVLMESTAME